MGCDLHMHSTASDGTDRPEALPALARQAGLKAIALTDHDTTAGLEACAAAAKRTRIRFVPGIELSVDQSIEVHGSQRLDSPAALHILGYFIGASGHLAKIQLQLSEARARRNPQMVAALIELGVKIDYDEVVKAAGGSGGPNVVGRPHIASVLVRKGYVKSIHEAFVRYLGVGGAAYVRKDRLSALEALEAIHAAGGLAVLAHPVQLGLSGPGDLEHVVARLKDLGLDGIETRHSDHSPADVEHFEQMAARFDLRTTGGSDYHGSRKAAGLGSPKVPLHVYERLHDAWSRRN